MPITSVISKEYREFYVIFERPTCSMPWHWITGGTWTHCWIMQADYGWKPKGLLTKRKAFSINMLKCYLNLRHYEDDPEIIAKEFLIRKNVLDIIKISLPFKYEKGYNVFLLLNCVTLIKVILNVKDFFILTPKQLYNHLLKIGGVSMKG